MTSGTGGATTGTGGATGTGGGTASGGTVGSGGAVGSGGSDAGTGGGMGSGADQFPADTSIAGIEAFLAMESYKTWTHDPAPRAPTDPTFGAHMPMMQVYFNEIAVANHEGVTQGGMLVKELYDESGAQVGVAASLKTSNETDLWTFYCTMTTPNAQGGCQDSSTDYPLYYVDEFITGCAACHGDAVLTPLP